MKEVKQARSSSARASLSCLCLAVRPRFEPRIDHQLIINTVHLTSYCRLLIGAPLFSLLVVRAGYWPVVTGIIRRKKPATFKKTTIVV